MGKHEGKRLLVRPMRIWGGYFNNGSSRNGMGWGRGLDGSGSEERQVADSCGLGNESSRTIEWEKFID